MMRTVKVAAVLLFSVSSAFANDVVKRGATIPANAAVVPLEEVLAKPRNFTQDQVVTEGVVEKVCIFAGCWMAVAPQHGKPGMRVTFAGGFSVPRGSKGLDARLMGKVKVGDDASTFIASGVELKASK